MEGVSDFPLRLWQCLVAPPESMATPFLRATASFPGRELPEKFAPELKALRGKLPYRLVTQVMAAEPEHFIQAASLLLKHTDFVELNCGCPSPTCTGKGAGSSLLRDAEELSQFVATITRALGAEKVAIKMRTGYDQVEEFPELLAALADYPVHRVTVHGRTRPQRYRQKARWDLIERAAQQLDVPVLASGDILDQASWQALRQTSPNVRGALIGRGALRNPFVFAELRGQKPAFAAQLITRMLRAFASFTWLYANNFELLLQLVDAGLGARAAGTQIGAWDEVLAALPPLPDEDRQSLGRVKMLWNYWRSSLPEAYFAPQVLRARSLSELLAAIDALAPDGDLHSIIEPRYRADLDWLYSGEGRPSAGAVAEHSPESGRSQA